MKRLFALSLTVLIASFACATVPVHQPSLQPAVAPAGPIENEEYAVYSALINNSIRDSDADERRSEDADRLLVINEQPSIWSGFADENADKFFAELKESSPDLQAEAVNDLRAKSDGHQKLERRFDIEQKYVLVSDEEIEDYFKQSVGGGWKAFYQKYPNSGGFVTFSRVGFNADQTQALVYQSHHCGGTWGGGSYLLLTKKNGAWMIERSVGPAAWVS